LRDDIASLRRAGWRTVSLTEALAFAGGSPSPAARCVLITTDDGHAEDEEWAVTLRQLECPAVTFVCSSLVPAERREFYVGLAARDEFAVEDHGFRHEVHASSSRVLGYMSEATPTRTREHVILAPGEPLLPTASEVASRRFEPNAEAIELLREAGRNASPAEIQGARWRDAVERRLLHEQLAVRRFGGLYLRGRFETSEEYEKRVTEYLRHSRTLFEKFFKRSPRYYAYTWWDGNRTTDSVLTRLGYLGSFHDTGSLQPPDGRTFAMPRIPVGPDTARPFCLDGYPMRQRTLPVDLRSLRHTAKRLLGIG
jgi:hypothetical protein